MNKRDNEDRTRAMTALNNSVVEVEDTRRRLDAAEAEVQKRLNDAKSELGVARAEHHKALKAYDTKRQRVLKLTKEIVAPEPVVHEARGADALGV